MTLQAVPCTKEVKHIGKTILELLIIWKTKPIEEATWEVVETIKEQFPYFCLGDKVDI